MKYSIVIIRPEIKIRDNQFDCILVFDPEKDFFYEFSPTGSELFSLLRKNKPVKEVIKIISQKYELSYKEAESNVKSFIDRLVKLRIVDAQS